jgi:hypothetical protein
MKCRLGKVARRRGLLGFSPNPQLSAFHLHVSAASEYHLRRPDQDARPRPRLATDEGGKCNPEFDSQLSPPLKGPASAARRTPTSHRRTSAPCQCGLLFKKLKGSCHANIYQRLFMLIPGLQNWPHRRPAHVVQRACADAGDSATAQAYQKKRSPRGGRQQSHVFRQNVLALHERISSLQV